MLFNNDVIFSGSWLFNSNQYVDHIEITGTKGKIWFGAFQHEAVHMEADGKQASYTFENLQHVQMPLINETVKFFQGTATNPCDVKNGLHVMEIIDTFTGLR